MIKKYIPKIVFGLFIVIFVVLFFTLKLNTFFSYENVLRVKEFILGFSFLGPVIILLLYAVFGLAVFPTFYFIFLSAFLYGPIYGFILGWGGMILGLSVSFFNSRYLFRKSFMNRFGHTQVVSNLENYTKKYHGWAVLFFRIFCVFPYNAQNVAYGLTSIRAVTYISFSAIGILPSTLLYVWLGDLTANNRIGTGDIKKVILFTTLFITVFASVFFTTLVLRKKMKFSEE